MAESLGDLIEPGVRASMSGHEDMVAPAWRDWLNTPVPTDITPQERTAWGQQITSLVPKMYGVETAPAGAAREAGIEQGEGVLDLGSRMSRAVRQFQTGMVEALPNYERAYPTAEPSQTGAAPAEASFVRTQPEPVGTPAFTPKTFGVKPVSSPQGFGEEFARGAGGAVPLAGETIAGMAFGLPAPAAVGLAGGLQPGTGGERMARAVAMAATAAIGEPVAGAIEAGPRGALGRAVAHTGTQAALWGGAEPIGESAMTGKPPTGEQIGRNTIEMLALAAMTHGMGALASRGKTVEGGQAGKEAQGSARAGTEAPAPPENVRAEAEAQRGGAPAPAKAEARVLPKGGGPSESEPAGRAASGVSAPHAASGSAPPTPTEGLKSEPETMRAQSLHFHEPFQQRDVEKGLVDEDRVQALLKQHGGYDAEKMKEHPIEVWKDEKGEIGPEGRAYVLQGHHRTYIAQHDWKNLESGEFAAHSTSDRDVPITEHRGDYESAVARSEELSGAGKPMEEKIAEARARGQQRGIKPSDEADRIILRGEIEHRAAKAGIVPKVPSAEAVKTLNELPVPGGRGSQKVGGRLTAAREKLHEALREVVKIANPVALAPKKGVDILGEARGRLEREAFRGEQDQKHLKKFWDTLSKGEVLDFWTRAERGENQPHPELQAVADQLHARGDKTWLAINKYKSVPYWENWLPHLFKDPKKVAEWMGSLPRRPLEGTKRFMKARVFADMASAIKAGHEPLSWNPEELMQRAEHDARKFVMVQEMIPLLKEAGLLKWGPVGTRAGKEMPGRSGQAMPTDFKTFDQRWAKTFLNPHITIEEWKDKAIMEGLHDLASELGVKTERGLKDRHLRGGVLGYAEGKPGEPGKVVSRFGTDESVILHEIGHRIDYMFPDFRKFVLGDAKAKEESRALSDLRFEGTPKEQVSANFQKYVRSRPEQIATMFQAYLHMPERFKEIAPNLYKNFTDALGANPRLKGVLDIKPSLLFEKGQAEVSAGGVILAGEYWGQKDLVQLLDNHMSRDLIGETTIGRGVMNSRNFINAMELGLSAFHATGMTLLSVMNRMSVGFSQLGRGELGEGLRTIARSPLAPLDYIKEGWKLYNGDASMAGVERDAFAGGMSIRERAYYKNQALDSFLRNYREFKTTLHPAAGLKAGLLAPFAAIEAPMRFLTTHVIPQMKIGAYREVFSEELLRQEKAITSGTMSRTEASRMSHSNIENRFGLLNYDNLYWNQTLKTTVMLLIRAPGWTLGTLREFGGAAFIDLPRTIKNAGKKGVPHLTQRQYFALSMGFTTLAVGGIYHYLHTGRRPETLEDYLHPSNGATDASGQEIRVDFPTYWKEVANWANRPVTTAFGTPVGHGGKLAPEATMFFDLLTNQTYRGPLHRPISSMDDWMPAAGEVVQYLYGRMTPFSIENYATMQRGAATTEEKAESFFGVTRHKERSQQSGGTYSIPPH